MLGDLREKILVRHFFKVQYAFQGVSSGYGISSAVSIFDMFRVGSVGDHWYIWGLHTREKGRVNENDLVETVRALRTWANIVMAIQLGYWLLNVFRQLPLFRRVISPMEPFGEVHNRTSNIFTNSDDIIVSSKSIDFIKTDFFFFFARG